MTKPKCEKHYYGNFMVVFIIVEAIVGSHYPKHSDSLCERFCMIFASHDDRNVEMIRNIYGDIRNHGKRLRHSMRSQTLCNNESTENKFKKY